MKQSISATVLSLIVATLFIILPLDSTAKGRPSKSLRVGAEGIPQENMIREKTARKKIHKKIKRKKAIKAKKKPARRRSGVQITVFPLNGAAGNFEPVQVLINQANLREGTDIERLTMRLREFASSGDFSGLNECLSEERSSLDHRSELEAILDGEAPNSCIGESVEAGLDFGDIGGAPFGSVGSDPYRQAANCVAQSSRDLMMLVGCLGRPSNPAGQMGIHTGGGMEEIVDHDPLGHTTDRGENSITQGFSIDTEGNVGSAGSFCINGVCGRGSVTSEGGGRYTFTGGPMEGGQYSVTINTSSNNRNTPATTPGEQAVTDAVREAQERDREEERRSNDNDTMEPDWNNDSGSGGGDSSCEGNEGGDGECEDETMEPDWGDEESTMPDPEGNNSEIPEECQRQELEERAERGELPGNLGPLIIPPSDASGEAPVFMACFMQLTSNDDGAENDCELDQYGMPVDPDGGSLCDDGGGGETVGPNYNGDAGRTDPEEPEGPAIPGGITSPLIDPECEDPMNPECTEFGL